jgi:hypothetical protein
MGDTQNSNGGSNVFTDVLGNLKSVEEKYIGPDYPYWKYIKMPSQMGMSDEGSLNALGNDINGLIGYVEVLVSGKSEASTTGGPLGNKFFLKTGGKCTDTKTNADVDRYVYINNVPEGDIPFVSSGMGVSFSEFRGLIPGVMGNLSALNPMEIMQSFMAGSKPACQEITLETIDVNNNKSTETHFVTTVDLQNMPPCMFPDRKNPITGLPCTEAFENLTIPNVKNDIFTNAYYLSLGVLGILILYYIIQKNKK